MIVDDQDRLAHTRILSATRRPRLRENPDLRAHAADIRDFTDAGKACSA
jgi:hypothetical protein